MTQIVLSFVERIERLQEERATLDADIAEVFDEASKLGCTPDTLRKVIEIRAICQQAAVDPKFVEYWLEAGF